jgi:hypothetical protein
MRWLAHLPENIPVHKKASDGDRSAGYLLASPAVRI